MIPLEEKLCVIENEIMLMKYDIKLLNILSFNKEHLAILFIMSLISPNSF